VCECTAFSFLAEQSGLTLDPFRDTRICDERGRVRIHNPGDYLVPGSGSVSVYMAESFHREISDCCIKDGHPCSGCMLIGSVKVCPPVIFRDQNVSNLQALEALLPAARVLGRGVSEVPVERGHCLCENLEAVEFIRAERP
jgi:hypothetical protein